jgi:hypothetical protein
MFPKKFNCVQFGAFEPMGSITLAFSMCSLDLRFTVECLFNVIFSVENSETTSTTHATVLRTSKLHI